MKVKDFIKRYKDGTQFFIGSYTSFFFIGTAEELQRDARKIDAGLVLFGNMTLGKRRANERGGHVTYKNGPDAVQNHPYHYVPIRERQVEESYPRCQKDGIVIIVDGIESGRFWTKNEYNAVYHKEN